MTKVEAINILRFDSRGGADFHKSQCQYLLRLAEALQQDYKDAKTHAQKEHAEFYYLKALQQVDAHLTLIDR